jgi:hypothetical protein
MRILVRYIGFANIFHIFFRGDMFSQSLHMSLPCLLDLLQNGRDILLISIMHYLVPCEPNYVHDNDGKELEATDFLLKIGILEGSSVYCLEAI